MKLEEYDWRQSWTREVLVALDVGMERLRAEATEGIGLHEHAEAMVGIGFVTLQTYARGTISDLNTRFPGSVPGVTNLLSHYSVIVKGSDVSAVHAIWAAANYYKHHDSWLTWSEKGSHTETVRLLHELSIEEDTEWPCFQLLKSLNFESLCEILQVTIGWRERWFAELLSRQTD